MEPAPQGSSSGRGLGDLGGWEPLGDLSLPAAQSSPAGRKRDAEAAEQETFESLLFQLGQDDAQQPVDGRAAPSGKPSAAAARNKASRERQRRERLNDWWVLASCDGERSLHTGG